MTAAPGVASPGRGAVKADYERTECVYPMGAPDQSYSGNPPVWHVRDFPYFGILTGGTGSGVNLDPGIVLLCHPVTLQANRN